MLFNSVEYLIFLFTIALFYYIIAKKYQWQFLLVCSYLFYMLWNIKHVLLLFFCTCTAFTLGRLIEQTAGKCKRVYLGIGITINLIILGVYKYYNFFAESLQYLLNKVGINVALYQLTFLLPMGISFFIFRILSYLIDVYKGRMTASHNVGKLALYISFFSRNHIWSYRKTAVFNETI